MRIIPYMPRDFEDFWKTRVNGWLLNDIKKCVENKINIGGTTLIFCYIDFFGSLLKPKSDSKPRFYYFIEKYLSQKDKKYDDFKCMLYENFRCGLVHEAIMKKGTGIFRSDDANDNGYSHLEMESGALFLDLIQLRDDLLDSVKKLKQDIDGDKKLKISAVKRLRDLKWELPDEPIR